MKTTHLPTAAVVLALLFGLSSCGSGSSTGSTATGAEGSPAPPSGGSRTTPSASEAPKGEPGGGSKSAAGGSGQGSESPTAEPHFTPRVHHDSGGGSKQFVHKGGDNSLQEYGSEGTGEDFREAAAALHTYLDARAAGAWGAACGALSGRLVEQLISQLGATSEGKQLCPEVLAELDSGIPEAAVREGAEADVAALRAQGDAGYLFYRGPQGEALFIPVHREGGHWKVAAVGPSPLS